MANLNLRLTCPDTLRLEHEAFTGRLELARFKIALVQKARRDPLFSAYKAAFTLEESTICARLNRGTIWEDHYFGIRHKHFANLLFFCKCDGYKHGTQGRAAHKMLLLDLPGCEQLSWYVLDYVPPSTVRTYAGAWDRIRNANLARIKEAVYALGS